MIPNTKEWPVLLVSGQFHAENDDGSRLRELVQQLQKSEDCTVITSLSYEDALEIFISRADIGCIIIDWDLEWENCDEKMAPEILLAKIRCRNRKIPVLLLTDHLETEKLPVQVLEEINDCLWKTADTADFIAGRIRRWVDNYIHATVPQFFAGLMKYAAQYKYAWHTPGHLGGQGFLRAPAGVAMYKFFGENTFRSDLSISVPELGSLLDHEGAAGDAERRSAAVFGADQTYYVLNGTSTVNQIIWRSQVLPNEIALVDRNCHKSLNYAMVITGAIPVYMMPRRNAMGIIGPVHRAEFSPARIKQLISGHPLLKDRKDKKSVKMAALTNSTYDGVCYNTTAIHDELQHVTAAAGMDESWFAEPGMIANLHFDEAWYAYAKFHPIYQNHYAMAQHNPDIPVFASQSTHKLLTAFSQASMLHIKNGTKQLIDPVLFNESYMMHGSTSPQYSMIASLDVATQMMKDNGKTIIGDIVKEAIQLRRKMASLTREFHKKGDWFFNMWQPEWLRYKGNRTAFHELPAEVLASEQGCWVMHKDNPWHGFTDIEDDFTMLDPIKLTITTPGINPQGEFSRNGGIPAAVVSNFLIKHNIVCEKSDYYSFLLLNSLGTTRAKQGSLLAALFNFKQLYDSGAMLRDVFPELIAAYPGRYRGETLKYHCDSMHACIREHKLLELMHKAFEVLPVPVMTPAAAHHAVVGGNVEMVDVSELNNRTAAVMIVPYPPGIPMLMGGETIDHNSRAIRDYLLARQDFENAFPGYAGDIHGITRTEEDGKTVFRTLCIRQK